MPDILTVFNDCVGVDGNCGLIQTDYDRQLFAVCVADLTARKRITKLLQIKLNICVRYWWILNNYICWLKLREYENNKSAIICSTATNRKGLYRQLRCQMHSIYGQIKDGEYINANRTASTWNDWCDISIIQKNVWCCQGFIVCRWYHQVLNR